MNALFAFADELSKIAKVTTSLLPHQQRVVDRIQKEDQPGLVVVHGLGSGKTLTSIAAQEAIGKPSQVIAPAALLGNYQKELKKHVKGKPLDASLSSMQNMANKGVAPDKHTLVVDEAHRARDPSSSTFQTLKGNTAEKRLLLTGSPFYNHPSDIAPLIDLAADAKILPFDKDEFSRQYISEKVIKPGLLDRGANLFRSDENQVKPGVVPILHSAKAPELRDIFKKWVDYHPGTQENFPEVTRENVQVPMSSQQLKVYDTLMDKAPSWVAAKVKRGLPPSKREAQQLNAFLTASRQAANSTQPFIQEGEQAEDPKIQKAFERLQGTLAQNPNAKAVVYSNFLDAGIRPYQKRLDEAKIPYGLFTGELPSKKRNQLVQDYNEGRLKALLLSSAGGEGLDLKGTRLMQLLEPHWNTEKLKQVEGRGARYKSHEGLPPEEQKLLIENYMSTRPQGLLSRGINRVIGRAPDKSVDEYLSQLSGDKEKLINQFRELLPTHKTAAAKFNISEESQKIRDSFKVKAMEEAASILPWLGFALPMAHAVHELGGRRADSAIAAAGILGGAAALGHYGKDVLVNTDSRIKAKARQAIKKPEHENYLREHQNTDFSVLKKLIPRTIIQMVPHALSKTLPSKADVGGLALSALGSLAEASFEGSINTMALHELENARRYEKDREGEKLKRLRKQIGQLEANVEGDGWKVHKEPEVKAAPKDKSGKNW